MPPIEDLLRDELKRVADTVQPGQLRPLQVPAPGRRWHRRLLPVAAAAAVIAVAVAAVLVAVPRPAPPSAPGPAAVPRYYLTFTYVADHQVHGLPVTEAVIRDSATGRITGTVKIVTDDFPAPVTVAAAPDDRSFIIGTYKPNPKGTRATDYQEYRFFRLPISVDGKPGHLTGLPAYPVPMYASVEGIALSPDGTLLAVSSMYNGPGRHSGRFGRQGRGHQSGHREGPDLDRRRPAGSLLRSRPAVLGGRRPDDRVHLAAQPEPDQRQHDNGGSPAARYRRARRQPGGFPDDRLAEGVQRHHPEHADHPRRA